MIITKTRLKQIIKEELEKVHLEQIEITSEEQLEEGRLKNFLTSLAVAGSLFGATKAKADPMEVEMHHRQSGERYTQVVDIPDAKAGMDKFDLQNLAQNFIDKKAEKAGLPPASFVVDKVKPTATAASQGGATTASDSSVTFDEESGFYKVVVPAQDKNNNGKILSALQKHLNKPNAKYVGSMFPDKGPKPGTVTILINPAGIK
jgi:hypothetical protein